MKKENKELLAQITSMIIIPGMFMVIIIPEEILWHLGLDGKFKDNTLTILYFSYVFIWWKILMWVLKNIPVREPRTFIERQIREREKKERQEMIAKRSKFKNILFKILF